ncbi:TPR domain protein [Stachybotrys elegans]|uniref:TPR domain protein n=1 Tax=Stachybotrys elegans TaxID=80388 RepID=A0A8K0WMF6_9HYPO|nr:TPR domain protein [Stachybotrys elegans]
MNNQDVSQDPLFAERLTRHQTNFRNALARSGERPVARASREEMLRLFIHNVARRATQERNGATDLVIPPPYPPCDKPLASLSKIMLSDLVLETHHRGTFAIVRSLAPSDKTDGINAIVEDEAGKVLHMVMYNQETSAPAAINQIIRKDMALVIKQPYLTVLSDDNHALRIDHVSDVMELPIHDGRFPVAWRQQPIEAEASSASWKAKGNDFFKQFRYVDAIKCYSNALTCNPPAEEAKVIKSNRAAANLTLKQFDAVLPDVEDPPGEPKLKEKALLRHAKALYGLERYRECLSLLENMTSEFSSNTEAQALLERTVCRCQEQETGEYKFYEFYRQAAENYPPLVDCATYRGPVVVKNAGAKGRGLFTTQAVKAGDLLFCEKAFAHVYVHPTLEKVKRRPEAFYNLEARSVHMGGHAELVAIMAQKLRRNPSLMPVIRDLHHGSYTTVQATEVDGQAVVDTFLLERIMALNAYACPLATRLSAWEYENDLSGTPEEELSYSCGIWPTASYINHSCAMSAARAFIGDMMIVRATRDMDADTEITWWYQSPIDKYYEERQPQFRPWGFICKCPICLEEKALTTSQRRDTVQQIYSLLPRRRQPDTVSRLEALFTHLDTTYAQPSSEMPRLFTWVSMCELASMYREQGQMGKAIGTLIRALESLGSVIEGGRPEDSFAPVVVKKWGGLILPMTASNWKLLLNCYPQVAPQIALQFVPWAKTAYLMSMGEDETFFQEV